MKLYVLVKDYDEGDFGGRPSISAKTFSTLEEAQKAMDKEIEEFEEEHVVDEDSIECSDTHFYCYADECHQYGNSPQLVLRICENEIL